MSKGPLTEGKWKGGNGHVKQRENPIWFGNNFSNKQKFWYGVLMVLYAIGIVVIAFEPFWR